MRRITKSSSARVADNENERGVIAPLAAILMVALLGFGALAVDVGAMYSEKTQLQNGADSAALAIAQDCKKVAASAPCSADQKLQAARFANGNALDGSSNVVSATVSVTGGAGTVDVTTETPAGSGGEHFSLYLARVLGVNSVEIRASAQAQWFYPTKGRSILPLVFAGCEFIDDGDPHKILTQGGTKGALDCNSKNPSGQIVPGGFAWLDPDGTAGCNLTATIGEWSSTSTGGPIPSGCISLFSDSLLGQTVAVPVYTYTCAEMWKKCSGNNTQYMIEKWAGFIVEGWSFPSNSAGPTSIFKPGENGIYGTFVGFSADPGLFTGTSPTPTGNVFVIKLTR